MAHFLLFSAATYIFNLQGQHLGLVDNEGLQSVQRTGKCIRNKDFSGGMRWYPILTVWTGWHQSIASTCSCGNPVADDVGIGEL